MPARDYTRRAAESAAASKGILLSRLPFARSRRRVKSPFADNLRMAGTKPATLNDIHIT